MTGIVRHETGKHTTNQRTNAHHGTETIDTTSQEMNTWNSPSWGPAAADGRYGNDSGEGDVSHSMPQSYAYADNATASGNVVHDSHNPNGTSEYSLLGRNVMNERVGEMALSRFYGSISTFDRQSDNNDDDDDNDDGEGVESNSIGTWNSETNDNNNNDNNVNNNNSNINNNNEEEEKKKEHENLKEKLDDSDSDSDVVQVWSKPAAITASTTPQLPPPPTTIPTGPPSSAAPTLGSIAASLTTSNNNNNKSSSSSLAASTSYQSRNHTMPTWMSSLPRSYPPSYNNSWQPFHPDPIYIDFPPEHVPTWKEILPPDFFTVARQTMHAHTQTRRKLILSLINVWEFTIAVESSTMMGSGSVGMGDTGGTLAGLRMQIKKIAKDHMGQGGRRGAVFERGSGGEGILPEDPLLKHTSFHDSATTTATTTNNNNNGGGKWRIPLGAYQALLTYLTQDKRNIVEGIPPEQLRAATLGRERFQKNFPTSHELIQRGVHPGVAGALAPYQRGGVDFVLEREGRALLADEMGLGKTVQAIAAMSAYVAEWPLLVLCPSSARYHWEVELRHWLGKSSSSTTTTDSNGEEGVSGNVTRHGWELKKEAINVVTSGKSPIFRTDGATKVVICSYGLIVSLVNSGRIFAGMFGAVIVDESHALKNKASKRTLAILPILKGADRCLLLSGTPALARPSELWPQLSVLGGRRKDGREDGTSGIWIDEEGFYSKYVRGELGEDNGSKARLAELHTLLTSTVMIRRMKADILKNLQPKIREKAFIDIKDPTMQNEFRIYMQMLRQGGGVMGKFARQQSNIEASAGNGFHQTHYNADGEKISSREALHHLYKITGQSKVSKVTHMLKRWLADPTLDAIGRGAGLSNHSESNTKYIRIDGATLPKTRQEQILSFQTDPTVRVALLGITAAGVAVTLTASSTVWFAELFWTPAIMIQAEDRCHRIGQQARVRCLYFIARGTLDEILWKLIEKKFRDLGEFVEGRENMDIALERELEEDEDAEILKVDDSGDSKKRKAHDDVNDLFDLEDDGIKEEIDELVHEEEDMLAMKNEEEDDDPDSEDKGAKPCLVPDTKQPVPQSTVGSSETSAICLLDEDEKEDKTLTIQEVRDLYTGFDNLRMAKFDHSVRFNNIVLYQMQFRGQRYGFNLLYFKGRAIVKESLDTGTKVGAVIVAVGRWVLRQEPFDQIQLRMKSELMINSPVTLTFADDSEFMALIKEDVLPHIPKTQPLQMAPPARLAPPVIRPTSETIDLLDDDDD
ncbi:hypothetical protein HJC23_012177 [Cyclotella cryptica]|uniref:Uncharacterized protein n=1 Tax=Cyclotella cryptica TaxID=29204 RepID=A0ABD3PA02_9STRA